MLVPLYHTPSAVRFGTCRCCADAWQSTGTRGMHVRITPHYLDWKWAKVGVKRGLLSISAFLPFFPPNPFLVFLLLQPFICAPLKRRRDIHHNIFSAKACITLKKGDWKAFWDAGWLLSGLVVWQAGFIEKMPKKKSLRGYWTKERNLEVIKLFHRPKPPCHTCLRSFLMLELRRVLVWFGGRLPWTGDDNAKKKHVYIFNISHLVLVWLVRTDGCHLSERVEELGGRSNRLSGRLLSHFMRKNNESIRPSKKNEEKDTRARHREGRPRTARTDYYRPVRLNSHIHSTSDAVRRRTQQLWAPSCGLFFVVTRVKSPFALKI